MKTLTAQDGLTTIVVSVDDSIYQNPLLLIEQQEIFQNGRLVHQSKVVVLKYQIPVKDEV